MTEVQYRNRGFQVDANLTQRKQDDRNGDDVKVCWICYMSDLETDAKDPHDHWLSSFGWGRSTKLVHNMWLSPCACRGSTKWVHSDCILRYIDERYRLYPMTVALCPICKEPLKIVHPSKTWMKAIYDTLIAFFEYVAILMLAMGMLLKIYCFAMLIGALIAYQLLGYNSVQEMMMETSPYVIWFVMPAIPIVLVTFQILNGEKYVLQLRYYLPACLRRWAASVPLPNFLAVNANVWLSVVIATTGCYCFLLNGPLKQGVFVFFTYMVFRSLYMIYNAVHYDADYVERVIHIRPLL